MSSVNYNIRIEKQLKEEAFSVLDEYGMTPAQAIKMFLKQIATTRSVPLSLNWASCTHIPNATTLQAMKEADARTDFSETYSTLEEFLEVVKNA